MKMSVTGKLFAAVVAALASSQAFAAIWCKTNETVSATSSSDWYWMNGGTVEYALADQNVAGVFLLCGETGTDTTFDSSGYTGERPLAFQRDIVSTNGKAIVFSESVRFGATSIAYNGGYVDVSGLKLGYDLLHNTGNRRCLGSSGYPFVGPDAVSFSDPDAKLILTGHVALAAWPSCRYELATATPGEDTKNTIAALGVEMFSGATYTLSNHNVVWMNPDAFEWNTRIVVPANRYLVVLRYFFRPDLTSLTSATRAFVPSLSGNVYYNDVELSGGTMIVASHHNWYHYGKISGNGTIVFEAATVKGVQRELKGDLSEFTGRIVVDAGGAGGDYAQMNGVTQNVHIIEHFADGQGDVLVRAVARCRTRMRFAPGLSPEETQTWKCAKLEGGGVYIGADAYDGVLAGATWELQPKQLFKVGLFTGGMGFTSPWGSGVEFGTIVANASLYFPDAMPVKVTGSIGSGASMRFGASGESSLDLPAGATLGTVTLDGGTLLVTGGAGAAIQSVVGSGTLKVVGGTVRIGATDASVNVRVANGGKAMLSPANLLDVTNHPNLILWMDASDLSSFRGATNSVGTGSSYPYADDWRSVDNELCEKNLVYTNDFPMIDQWYDVRAEKRPVIGADGYDAAAFSQGKFYFYNDRYIRNVPSPRYPYPQFFPYLMTNQVNGKAVLAFGTPGTQLTRSWSAGSSGAKERRSMSLIYGAQTVRTAVMVFGSQEGGGRAVLGGYATGAYGTTNIYTRSNCSGGFTRGGAAADRSNPATPIFAEAVGTHSSGVTGTWLDGEEVDPYTQGFNGGYQVLSFNAKGRYFRSIGYNESFPTDGSESGGARYGEIMIFGGTSASASVSAAVRQTAEQYLAQKWDVASVASPIKGTVVAEAGGEVETVGTVRPAGAGTWRISTDTVVRSDFAGSIAGAGNVRVVDGVAAPHLDSGFSGTFAVETGTLPFTFDENGPIASTMSAAANIKLPSSVTIEVSSAVGHYPVGEFTLVSGASLSGAETLSVSVTDFAHAKTFSARREGNSIILTISPQGMMILAH